MKNIVVIILVASGFLQFALAFFMPWKKLVSAYEIDGKVMPNKKSFLLKQKFLYILIGIYMIGFGFLLYKDIFSSKGQILVMAISLMIICTLPSINKFKTFSKLN